MHGSDRVPDLNIDYERALVGRAKATASTRAKWRSSPSACCSVLENCLTPPTLSERRFFNSQPMNRGRNRSECPCRHIPRLLVEKIPSLFLKHSLKRRLITSTAAYDNCCYWLDLGNNADSGQFVLGQPGNPKNKRSIHGYRQLRNYFQKSSIQESTRKTSCPHVAPLRPWSVKNHSSTRCSHTTLWQCWRGFSAMDNLLTMVGSKLV